MLIVQIEGVAGAAQRAKLRRGLPPFTTAEVFVVPLIPNRFPANSREYSCWERFCEREPAPTGASRLASKCSLNHSLSKRRLKRVGSRNC